MLALQAIEAGERESFDREVEAAEKLLRGLVLAGATSPKPASPKPASPKPQIEEAPKLGIDLKKRGHEVRKLLFAGFRGMMASARMDPEDVLQEVFAGILLRNKGTCPWDERKSTFGFYVHMVCRCVLTNAFRKQERRAKLNGAEMYDEEFHGAGQWRADDGDGFADLGRVLRSKVGVDYKERMALDRLPEIAPLIAQGLRRAEIVSRTGVRAEYVTDVSMVLRRAAAEACGRTYVSARSASHSSAT